MKEFETIFKYFSPLSKGIEGSLDLSDDGAVIDLGGEQMLVVTSDACVEDVHFPKNTPPDIVARRALRVNLSDLAAMSAIPLGYTHSLICPKNTDETWIATYVEGLRQDQETFKIHLIGGDTTTTNGPLTIAITAFGRVQKGFELKRSKALSGDRLYLTGPIGDAHLGLKILKGDFQDLPEKSKDYLIERYYLPTPRIREVDKLKRHVNSGTDISDGLLADLEHICSTSRLQAFVDKSRIPLSKPAKAILDSLPEAKQKKLFSEMITAGDDYELILSIPPDKCEDAQFSAQTHGFKIYPFGHMGLRNTNQKGNHLITVVDKNGVIQKFKAAGYQHSW